MRHVPALVALAACGVLLTAPLPWHLSTAIVGTGGGDNVAALWNVWWVRTALDGPSLFTTPLIFAPLGTSLVLHSLAPLVSMVAVLATPGAGVVTTYNAALLGCALLNLWIAYALAWTLAGDRMAAVFAGVAFAGAPMVLVRLYGHLNLAAAWVLPLMLLTVIRFAARPGWAAAVFVSIALAAAAYTDYYYVIFGTLMCALYVGLLRTPVSVTSRALTHGRRRALAVLAATFVVLAGAAGWIAVTGGATTEAFGERLRFTGTFNLRVAMGLIAAAALVVWKRPALRRLETGGPQAEPVWRYCAGIAALTLLLVSPLLAAALGVWMAGDYSSQVYLWRSAPPGVDIATAVLGSPLSWLTGAWTTSVYGRLGIDGVEGVAWVGLAPLVLAAFAIRSDAMGRYVRTFTWIGAFFLVWSMGPYLQVFGRNTGIMLPETLIRFVPVVANARIPGRAFVVVALMVALLAAAGLASIRRARRRRLMLAAWVLLAVDIWPRPHPLVEVSRSAVHDRLRAEPPGVVLEIPAGFRDGFGERGRLNPWALAHQTQHGHAMVGGFVARLSRRVGDAYDRDPVLRALFDASEGRAVTGATGDCRDSLACPVRYVVLHRPAAPPALVELVEATFRLREIGRDAERTLFAVEGMRACACAGGAAR